MSEEYEYEECNDDCRYCPKHKYCIDSPDHDEPWANSAEFYEEPLKDEEGNWLF